MRTPSVVVIVALAGCWASNPDPRQRTLQVMQTTGDGAWAEVILTTGAAVDGELIAVDGDVIRILPLDATNVISIAKHDIQSGRLYRYEAEGGFGAWGAVGGLSTLSHGFWLVFSLPLWAVWTGATSASESGHVILEFRRGIWPEAAKWARFPQGMPPGFGQRAPGATAPVIR